MKLKILLLSIFISKNVFSQQYVLIDRELAWKSYLTDSLTKKITEEYLPIYKTDIDSLSSKLEPLWNISSLGMKRTYINENNFATGSITFKITAVGGTYGDKYDILLISQIEHEKFNYRLSNSSLDASVNRGRIQDFIKDLRKTKKEISNNKIKVK